MAAGGHNKGRQKRKKGKSAAKSDAPLDVPLKETSNSTYLSFAAWPLVVAAMLAIATTMFSDSTEESTSNDTGKSSCGLVMAPSSLPGDTGWGVFSLKHLPPRVPALSGDIVIHVPDIPAVYADGLDLLIHDYMWIGEVAGGQFEGKRVLSHLPSVGMLANGQKDNFNLVPYIPEFNHAGLHRAAFPGAGAISQHHNYTFYTYKDIPAGGELLVNYGTNWLSRIPQDSVAAQRDVSWLKENGLCLDNIKPQYSTNNNAGRGAFATRFLGEGSVIAPSPVIPVTSRAALKMVREERSKTTGKVNLVDKGQQLMLNYCYGHPKSSMLFFPYGPGVNYINHDSKNPNAKLRWSTSNYHSGREWLDWPLDKVKEQKHSGLVLEFVATKDIKPGEEIFIDYGEEWEDAWNSHVSNWKASPEDFDYFYPSEMNNFMPYLLTVAEQEELKDYPKNIMTACYYQYREQQTGKDGSTSRWEVLPGTFQPPNLRPCSIISREEEINGQFQYTVAIYNYAGHMAQQERVPDTDGHIVTHVPRHAIKFVDKVYSSDQHLENAFRHEIVIPDEIFPKQWMDLS